MATITPPEAIPTGLQSSRTKATSAWANSVRAAILELDRRTNRLADDPDPNPYIAPAPVTPNVRGSVLATSSLLPTSQPSGLTLGAKMGNVTWTPTEVTTGITPQSDGSLRIGSTFVRPANQIGWWVTYEITYDPLSSDNWIEIGETFFPWGPVSSEPIGPGIAVSQENALHAWGWLQGKADATVNRRTTQFLALYSGVEPSAATEGFTEISIAYGGDPWPTALSSTINARFRIYPAVIPAVITTPANVSVVSPIWAHSDNIVRTGFAGVTGNPVAGTWTLDPAGDTAGLNGHSGFTMEHPNIPPENVLGLEFRTKRNGTHIDTARIPWGNAEPSFSLNIEQDSVSNPVQINGALDHRDYISFTWGANSQENAPGASQRRLIGTYTIEIYAFGYFLS